MVARGRACVLLAVLFMLAVCPAAGAATTTSRSQAVVASRLARELASARTANQRYDALLSMMKALHIGVYRGNGQPVIRGAERSAQDFYVYDFTLRYLAAAVAKRRTVSLGTVATELRLALAPLKPPRALTPALLRTAMRRTVTWARRHPRSGDALPPQLLRELGRSRVKQDLATPPAARTMRLDAVQVFLVEADFAAAIATARRGAAPSAATTAAQGRAAGPCAEFKPLWDAIKDAKLAGEVLEKLRVKKYADAVKKLATEQAKDLLTNFAVKLISFGALTDLIEVSKGDRLERALNERDSTHYGPPEHKGGGASAGKPLSYGIRVSMPKVPEMVAECGYLAGIDVKFPDQDRKTGVLTHAPVSWQDTPGRAFCATDPQPKPVPIDEHGTPYAYPTTNDNGDAFYELDPNNEPDPGHGPICAATGELRASVNVADIVEISAPFSSWLNSAYPKSKFQDFEYSIEYHRAGLPAAFTGTVTVKRQVKGIDILVGDEGHRDSTFAYSVTATRTGGDSESAVYKGTGEFQWSDEYMWPNQGLDNTCSGNASGAGQAEVFIDYSMDTGKYYISAGSNPNGVQYTGQCTITGESWADVVMPSPSVYGQAPTPQLHGTEVNVFSGTNATTTTTTIWDFTGKYR